LVSSLRRQRRDSFSVSSGFAGVTADGLDAEKSAFTAAIKCHNCRYALAIRRGIGHSVRVLTRDPISVLVDRDRTEEWSVTRETLTEQRAYRLTLDAPDGRSWSADAPDIFECLMEVRTQVEPLGLRLCCNGSRRNAWASGMLRDMGGGLAVYLLSLPRTSERPPQVDTLGPAAPGDVVSVAEQRAWYQEWIGPRPDGA
jgi:hypothetical protein